MLKDYLDSTFTFPDAEGSKAFFCQSTPRNWGFDNYARLQHCHISSERVLNLILNEYKANLIWVVKQDIPRHLKAYVGELRRTVKATDFKTRASSSRDSAHVLQEVRGDNTTVIGVQTIASGNKESPIQGKRKVTGEGITSEPSTKKPSFDVDTDEQTNLGSFGTGSSETSFTASYVASESGSDSDNNLQRKYVLDLHELYDEEHQSAPLEMSVLCTLSERLDLSSIKYIDVQDKTGMIALKTTASYTTFVELGDDAYNAIKRWRRDMSAKVVFFQPSPTTVQEATIYQVLTHTNLNAELPSRLHLKRLRWTKTQTEMDFLARHVIQLIQSLFSSMSDIEVEWNTLSFVFEDTSSTIYQRRSDMLFTTKDGIEIGNGEVKAPGAGTLSVEEDRARVAELCKRQLHLRMKEAKSEGEFFTFGIMIIGVHIELTIMVFTNGQYHYGVVKTFRLPTTQATYNDMEEALGTLLGWKETMLKSQRTRLVDAPYIYDEYRQMLKPTLSFVK